jgi:hypothetical protein
MADIGPSEYLAPVQNIYISGVASFTEALWRRGITAS